MDRETLALVLLKEGHSLQKILIMEGAKPIFILTSTGQRGLALLCYTEFTPQHPQAASSPRAGSEQHSVLAMPLITGRKLGLRTPAAVLGKGNTTSAPLATILDGFSVVDVLSNFPTLPYQLNSGRI